MLMQILISGLVALDLSDPDGEYFVHSRSVRGFGEPEIDASYAEALQRHGSQLTYRRFQNRVVSFDLLIKADTGGVSAREAARNTLADVLDQARRYSLGEIPGVTTAEGEVVLKYRPSNGQDISYARVLDGLLGSSEFSHSGGAIGTLNDRAIDARIPVQLVLEPFWREERPVYLTNLLHNASFEATDGIDDNDPVAWAWQSIGSLSNAASDLSESLVRSERKSWRLSAFVGDPFILGTSVLGSDDRLATTAGGAGASQIYQVRRIADIGCLPGETIRVATRVYLTEALESGQAVLRLEVIDSSGGVLQTITDTTTEVGEWLTLQTITDLHQDAFHLRITERAEVVTTGAVTAYFDDVLLDNHNHGHQLLLGGGFDVDSDGDGLADGWSSIGDATATFSRPTSFRDDSSCQQIVTAGSGQVILEQMTALADVDPPLAVGEAVTLGVWCNITEATGDASAHIALRFLDAFDTVLTQIEPDAFKTSVGSEWLSLSAAVPRNTHRIQTWLIVGPSNGSITVQLDDATLYRGHSDQSAGRFWPTPEWVGSRELTSDPAATDGRQITLTYADLRGNVPSPCQILVGVDDETPNPLIIGHKPGDPGFVPWSDSSAATIIATTEITADVADGQAVGGMAHRWTPATTAETPLLLWDGSDTPPGRYLIALRVKPSPAGAVADGGIFSFRAAVRVAETLSTAGTWNLILFGQPAWVQTTDTFDIWTLGPLPLPLLSRLPSYVNAVRFEIWGRCADRSLNPSILIDGVWFIPMDGGYFESQKSFYAEPVSDPGVDNLYQVVADSLTPVPGGLYSLTNGAVVRRLPSTITDRPKTNEEQIYLTDRGKLSILVAGAGHNRDIGLTATVIYQPLWATAGATR